MSKQKKIVSKTSKSSQTAFSYAVLAFSRLSFLTHLPQRVLVYSLVFLISFTARFAYVDVVPVAVTHDEVFYANQAHSLAKSGTAQDGVWKPSDLVSAHPLFAEWPAVVMQPGYWFFADNPLLASRFMSVVLGALVPIVLAEISFALFKKKQIAIAVVLLSSLNPWLFQVSRHGFDVLFTTFFYLLALLLLLKTKQFWKLMAVPFLLLGFLQYQGGKVILVPFVLMTLIYLVFESRKKRGVLTVNGLVSLLLTLVVSIVTTAGFIYFLSSQPAASRVSNISILDMQQIEQIVGEDRQNMIAVEALPSLLFNKPTVIADILLAQLGKSIDFTQLFISGERLRNPTTVLNHGLFYAIDALLLLIGLSVSLLDKRWRSTGLFIFSLIGIGMLPQLLNNQDVWIFLRLGFSFSLLPLFLGVGAHYLWSRFEGQLLRRGVMIFVYLLSVSYFAIQYAFVTPVTATGDKYFSERVLASYIERVQDQYPVIVLADEDRFVFEELVFYNSLLNSQRTAVQAAFRNTEFTIPGLSVKTDCFDVADVSDSVVVRDTSVVECQPSANNQMLTEDDAGDEIHYQLIPTVTITAPYSGEERFIIINDHLCKGDVASAHPPFTFDTIQPEKLSTQEFCRTFIIHQK